MACPPVPGDHPRASASGLSYVQVDKYGITILYHFISVNLAHHEIFRAKVGNGDIMTLIGGLAPGACFLLSPPFLKWWFSLALAVCGLVYCQFGNF